MRRVLLVHWNAAEAEERAGRLRSAGYAVTIEAGDGAGLRGALKASPSAVVIDLSRLPAQGRDAGIHLRQRKATRHVPLVFVGGVPEKVARCRKLLPDAAYVPWSRIRSTLKRSVAAPPASPVVPASSLAGYSGTPLPKKLGIKAGSTVALVGAPRDFETTLGELPDGVRFRRQARGKNDRVIWFTRSRRELDNRLERIAGLLADGGGLWIAWPKKTSGLASDLTQAEVRRIGLASGLVDYKVCAIDETWSGLLFAVRKAK